MLIVQKIIFILLLIISAAAISCNSSRSSEDKASRETVKSEKPNSSIPLPPGQSDIKAIVKNHSENGNNILAVIKVDEVLKNGPSAPPIAPGSEIELLIPKQYVNNNENRISAGDTLSMRISFNHGINNENTWKFEMLLNK